MNRNQRLSLIRGWLHDLVCVSGCTPSDGDHAKRTQHSTAVALEAALGEAGDQAAAARALHDHLCLAYLRSAPRKRELRECRHTSGELPMLPYDNAVAGLTERLSGAGA